MSDIKVVKGHMTHSREELLGHEASSSLPPPDFPEDILSFVSGRSKSVQEMPWHISFGQEVTHPDGVNTWRSPLKEVCSGGPVRTIKVLTFNREVELRKAENAWRPSVRKVKEIQDPEDSVTQELFRQMRSILNKLTPEKFERLMKQIKELAINKTAQLDGIGKMVMEKAICETKFASTYAKMCCELKELAVPVCDYLMPLDFHAVIIDLCQVEFWKVTGEGAVLEKEWRNHRAAKGEDRQSLQELEAKATAHRKRAVGSMRFIGELHKLGMVKDGVILEYATEFLDTETEEAMECLCCLITTTGSILDSEELKPEMDEHFSRIESILQERKLASRVRFKLQDLVDLRQNNWVPRREEQGPKTIDQIHKEVEEESQLATEEGVSKQLLSKMVESRNTTPESSVREMSDIKVVKGRMTHSREELLRHEASSSLPPPDFPEDILSFVSGRSKSVQEMPWHISFGQEVTHPDGVNTWRSPLKEVCSGEPVRTIKVLTFNREVELRKAENAWRPSVRKVKEIQDPEDSVTQELFRQMRSILNKLTPEKFERLMKQIKELAINTAAQLDGIGKMVMEKAICETKFASTYAKMCCELKELAVPVCDYLMPLDFHAVIIDLCQVEFWKVTGEGAVLEKEWRNHRAAKGEDRQSLQELEAKATAHRKRAVGSMKFIGELHKLGMVKDGVILEYATEFLDTETEEAMDCLCCLITTTGSILDSEELKPEMDKHFSRIESILQERKLASRVCFKLQDLVDLRQNNWVPRREEQGPKTIDQIHKEVEKESQLATEEGVSKQLLSKMVESRNTTPESSVREMSDIKVVSGRMTHSREELLRHEASSSLPLPDFPEDILSFVSGRSKSVQEMPWHISFGQEVTHPDGVNTWRSPLKEVCGGERVRTIKVLTFNREVELRKAENAWRPSVRKVKEIQDPEDSVTQELFRQMRSILNKLTPEKFERLMKQIKELAINTAAQLDGIGKMVMEKAICETKFASTYAKMCCELKELAVPVCDYLMPLDFHAVIIDLCQVEFWKVTGEGAVLEKEWRNHRAAKGEDRQSLQELEAKATAHRKRAVGSMRFIGELHKLGMVKDGVILEYATEFLDTETEEAMECLCCLITTTGSILDSEELKPEMDKHFSRIESILQERKLASRVCFKLQDLVDLRQNNWVPRREEQGPKTIDQIHKEVEKESQLATEEGVSKQLLSKMVESRNTTPEKIAELEEGISTSHQIKIDEHFLDSDSTIPQIQPNEDFLPTAVSSSADDPCSELGKKPKSPECSSALPTESWTIVCKKKQMQKHSSLPDVPVNLHLNDQNQVLEEQKLPTSQLSSTPSIPASSAAVLPIPPPQGVGALPGLPTTAPELRPVAPQTHNGASPLGHSAPSSALLDSSSGDVKSSTGNRAESKVIKGRITYTQEELLQHEASSSLPPPDFPEDIQSFLFGRIHSDGVNTWSSPLQGEREDNLPKAAVGQGTSVIPVHSGEPVRTIKVLTFNREVELRKAENAWRPSVRKVKEDQNPEEIVTQELFRQMRSILNKLTPEKFEQLIKRIKELSINTVARLEGIGKMVLEKAIFELKFASTYAKMCCELKELTVPGSPLNFHSVMLDLCQEEFWKVSDAGAVLEREWQDQQAAEGGDRQSLQEVEAKRTANRKRAVGYMKFLGEMYRLGLVKDYVILEFVTEFLGTKTEEAMDCLCCLITTTGSMLDSEELKPVMDRNVRGIESIIQEKKLTSRVCFKLQDLVDLRQNNWVPRREEQGPKTIDQIHKEVEEESQLATEEGVSKQLLSKMVESRNTTPEKKAVPRDERGPKPISWPHKETEVDDQSQTSKASESLGSELSEQDKTCEEQLRLAVQMETEPAVEAEPAEESGSEHAVDRDPEFPVVPESELRVESEPKKVVKVDSELAIESELDLAAESKLVAGIDSEEEKDIESETILMASESLGSELSEQDKPWEEQLRLAAQMETEPAVEAEPAEESGSEHVMDRDPEFPVVPESEQQVESELEPVVKVDLELAMESETDLATESKLVAGIDAEEEKEIESETILMASESLGSELSEQDKPCEEQLRFAVQMETEPAVEAEPAEKSGSEHAVDRDPEFPVVPESELRVESESEVEVKIELELAMESETDLATESKLVVGIESEEEKEMESETILSASESLGSELSEQDKPCEELLRLAVQMETEPAVEAEPTEESGSEHAVDRDPEFPVVPESELRVESESVVKVDLELAMEFELDLATESELVAGIDSEEEKEIEPETILSASESLGSELSEQDKPCEEQLRFAVQMETEPAVEAEPAEESGSEHAVHRDPEFPVVPESELRVESEPEVEVKIELELAMESEMDLATESKLVVGIESEEEKEMESETILSASESLGSELSEQDKPCEELLRLAVQMETEPAVEAEPTEESGSEHAVDRDPEFPVVPESELRVESESVVKVDLELAMEFELDLATESELVAGIDSEEEKEIEPETILSASESLGSELSEQDKPCEELLSLAVQMETEPAVEAEPAEESGSEHAVDRDPEFPVAPESEQQVESEPELVVKVDLELAMESESDLATESTLVAGIDAEEEKEIESETILSIPNSEPEGAVHDVTFCVDSEHQMAPDRTESSPAMELAIEVLEEYFMRYCAATLQEGQEGEEALECLCHLLSTIGRKMDTDRAKCLIDKCMHQLEDILKEGKTSNRIRLIIQDIMDLRQNNWAPRDGNQESKATGQVHKDAELENQQEGDKVEQQLVRKMSKTQQEHTSEEQRTCKEHDSHNRGVREYRGEHQGNSRPQRWANRAHQGHSRQISEGQPAHEIHQRWNYGEHNGYDQDLRWNRRERQDCTQDQRWFHGEHEGRAVDQRWFHGEHEGRAVDQRWFHGEHEGRAVDQRWFHGEHEGRAVDQRWFHGEHEGRAVDQRWFHGEHEGRALDQEFYHWENQDRAQDHRLYHGEHQGHAQGQRWDYEEHQGRAQNQRWYHGEHQSYAQNQRQHHGEHYHQGQHEGLHHGEHHDQVRHVRLHHGEHQGQAHYQRWHHGEHEGRAQDQRWYHGENQVHAENRRQHHRGHYYQGQHEGLHHGEHHDQVRHPRLPHMEHQCHAQNQRQSHREHQGPAQHQRWHQGEHEGRAQDQRWYHGEHHDCVQNQRQYHGEHQGCAEEHRWYHKGFARV